MVIRQLVVVVVVSTLCVNWSVVVLAYHASNFPGLFTLGVAIAMAMTPGWGHTPPPRH